MKIRTTLNIFFLIFLINTISIFSQEDEKIELSSISFIGNEYFTSSELEGQIISKETPNWFYQFLNSFSSFGNPPSYFDSLLIHDDITILKNLYMANGFFEVSIKSNFEIEKNGSKQANLTYTISENEPFEIKEYKFSGFESLGQILNKELNDIVTLDTAIQYSDNLIKENQAITMNYLQDKGFMLVETQAPVIKIDTIKNNVDVDIKFNVGKRYRIGNISVEKNGPGKNLVNESLIREIVNIKNNSYYSYHENKLSQVRLYRTNLFSSAVITPEYSDTVGNTVPLSIITEIGKLNEIAPELILINEDQTLKFGVGLNFTNKNFLGGARKLTIGASTAAQDITEFIKQASLADTNLSGFIDTRIGIEQPFLFGKAINTKFETFYTLEKKKNEWNASIYGAKLNLNFELPPYIYLTSLSTYYTWQKAKYIFQEDYLKTRLPDTLVNGSLSTNSTSAILGVQFTANKTDDLLFPSEGYSLNFVAEDGNSIPYGISEIGNYNFNQPAYYKLVLTGVVYFDFLKQYLDSFGAKIRLGNIQTYYGESSDIPYNQRFTAGGSNSLRGWPSNGLPKFRTVLTNNPTQQEIENIARNVTPGGFFLIEGSLEGRHHLSDLIGFAAFIDYGNVWDSYNVFRYDNVAISAGFGFRFYLEFAPIRLDFGFRAYDPEDRRSFFTRLSHSPFLQNMEIQFGIGEAF